MDIEKIVDAILTRISSKGDLATALLGFVLGYVLNVKFPFAGLAPGTAAALSTMAATGVKNGAQGLWDHFRAETRLRKADQRRRDELEQNATVIEEIDIHEDILLRSALKRLRSDRDLWRKQLITDQEFRGTITDFVDRYRRFQVTVSPDPAAATEAFKRKFREISTEDV